MLDPCIDITTNAERFVLIYTSLTENNLRSALKYLFVVIPNNFYKMTFKIIDNIKYEIGNCVNNFFPMVLLVQMFNQVQLIINIKHLSEV